jgi:hypothetical protein
MDRPELLSQLPRLRRAQVGNLRVPHKPLLLLWLFGRFATTGTTLVSYQDAGAASSSTPCWSSGTIATRSTRRADGTWP